jgi:hypothetical protein
MKGDVDMFRSVTSSVIIRDVDGGLGVAEHGSIDNWHIKFFKGGRSPDPLVRREFTSHISGFTCRSLHRLLYLRTSKIVDLLSQKRLPEMLC